MDIKTESLTIYEYDEKNRRTKELYTNTTVRLIDGVVVKDETTSRETVLTYPESTHYSVETTHTVVKDGVSETHNKFEMYLDDEYRKLMRFTTDGNDAYAHLVSCVYDEHDRVISCETCMKNNIIEKEEYSYCDDGSYTLSKTYKKEGNVFRVSRTTFDKNNEVIKHEYGCTEYSNTNLRLIEYYEGTDIKKKETQILSDCSFDYVTYYNKNGNVIAEYRIYKHINGADAIECMDRYEYDDKGRILYHISREGMSINTYDVIENGVIKDTYIDYIEGPDMTLELDTMTIEEYSINDTERKNTLKRTEYDGFLVCVSESKFDTNEDGDEVITTITTNKFIKPNKLNRNEEKKIVTTTTKNKTSIKTNVDEYSIDGKLLFTNISNNEFNSIGLPIRCENISNRYDVSDSYFVI